MSGDSGAVRFLYRTKPGRVILKLILKSHLDALAVRFLWSSWSRPLIRPYVKRNHIDLDDEQIQSFGSFREFFVRSRESVLIDPVPGHLISPCDGWLSAFPIEENSSFFIKGSHYRLEDLLQDTELARQFHGGDCLIFRLCASDYHHYCYFDNGYQGEHHYIPGELHSVQPIACETYPVYTLNRRCWSLLATEHFGPVVQTEIGALVVGGIFNECQNSRFVKGTEKGHFELAGSTIVLLFQKGRMRLLPGLDRHLANGAETRVIQGRWIGEKNCGEAVS